MKTNFLKIGAKIFNPNQIVSINLDFCDESTKGVSISLSDGEFYVFEEAEAEILKQYFMLGAFAIDLNNLYGEVKNGGQR
jgi:hypothetical protein